MGVNVVAVLYNCTSLAEETHTGASNDCDYKITLNVFYNYPKKDFGASGTNPTVHLNSLC